MVATMTARRSFSPIPCPGYRSGRRRHISRKAEVPDRASLQQRAKRAVEARFVSARTWLRIEFDLLELLMRHLGEVLTRATITERVWSFVDPSHLRSCDADPVLTP
jgi:DNA-binding response OmpR family regulator